MWQRRLLNSDQLLGEEICKKPLSKCTKKKMDKGILIFLMYEYFALHVCMYTI